MKVMIVDDELDIAKLVALLLERRGHQCLPLDSSETVLDVLARERFDVIICDLIMPGLGGRELYEALVARHDPAARRIAFITANSGNQENLRFLEECGRPWLQKPFGAEKLEEFLDQLLPSLSDPDEPKS